MAAIPDDAFAAAAFVRAFYQAVEEMQTAPFPKDHPCIVHWAKLYSVVTGSSAGRGVLAEIERLKMEIAGFEKAATLTRAGMASLSENYDRLKHENRELKARLALYDDFVTAVLALEPHADAANPPVEALLDHVTQVRLLKEQLARIAEK